MPSAKIKKKAITNVAQSASNNTNRYQSEQRRRFCVSKFSLYTNLVSSNSKEDPIDVVEAISSGEFKTKLSKSTKKRMRRVKKKRECRLAMITKTKKQTKKDIKRLARKLAKM